MKRFKNILCLTDGSKGEKAVLARAAQLASDNGAKLTLFDTIDSEDFASSNPAIRSTLEALSATRLELRRKELSALRKSELAKHPKLRIELEIQTGNRARSTVRAVLTKHYDLVVKAAEGGSDRLRVLFGSTDQTLMRKCPCPVWIIKPTRKRRFHKILAAVDLNPTESTTDELAKHVLSLATSLAKTENAELHVLHAWRLAGEYKLRGRQIYASKVDKLLDEIRAAHQNELDALLSHHPYDRRTVHLLKGRAGDLIPKAVEKLGIDLIVIGTVGRSGVPGLLIGNTAETVLHSVDCSVLTLKPEGFVSPLQTLGRV